MIAARLCRSLTPIGSTFLVPSRRLQGPVVFQSAVRAWTRSLWAARAPLARRFAVPVLRPPLLRPLVTTAARGAFHRLTKVAPAKIAAFSTEAAPSLWARLKRMVKDYWYIVIPVYVANATLWFLAIYGAVAAGFNAVPWLEWLRFIPQPLIDKLRDSPNLGNIAISLIILKLVSPLKTLMTLSLATLAIRVCARRGLITSSQAVTKASFYASERRTHYRALYGKRREELRGKWHSHRDRFHHRTQNRFRRRK